MSEDILSPVGGDAPDAEEAPTEAEAPAEGDAGGDDEEKEDEEEDETPMADIPDHRGEGEATAQGEEARAAD